MSRFGYGWVQPHQYESALGPRLQKLASSLGVIASAVHLAPYGCVCSLLGRGWGYRSGGGRAGAKDLGGGGLSHNVHCAREQRNGKTRVRVADTAEVTVEGWGGVTKLDTIRSVGHGVRGVKQRTTRTGGDDRRYVFVLEWARSVNKRQRRTASKGHYLRAGFFELWATLVERSCSVRRSRCSVDRGRLLSFTMALEGPAGNGGLLTTITIF